MRIKDARPLVAHVVFRFDVGGLENGVVNLLNGLPSDRYRHTVISLTEATHFHERVRVDDVDFVSLHKPPGHGFWLGPRLFRIFRRLRPTIVHTRNLAALESLVPAWLAGVPVRIHGEHGRDVGDLDGSNQTYRLVRRAGGVPLAEIDYRSMASRIAPGLHLVGEMLDCDGRIGGFNFQWAWATGHLAGRAAARAVAEETT